MSNVELLKLQFYNYLNEPVLPTRNVLIRSDNKSSYTITQEESTHQLGHRAGGILSASWQIVDNTLVVIGQETDSTQIVDSILEFSIAELTTSERVYTRFKFIS